MTVKAKQRIFAKKIAQLILYAYKQGYEVVCGEFYRPPTTAATYERKGVGIRNSLHCKCLAADLNLFKDDVWLTDTESYRFLGEEWEKMSEKDINCCWGGSFSDGGHFSIQHGEIR